MKSRRPSLDWIRKVLTDDETVAGDLQAPLVPQMDDEARAPAPANNNEGRATPLPALNLVK